MSLPPGISTGGSSGSTGITRGSLGFSLGAVGGTRGTGAGALRILIQFITQYNRGQLEQLAQDIKKLEAERVKAQANVEAAAKRVTLAETQTQRAKEATKKLDETSKGVLGAILQTQDKINDRVDRHLSVAKLRNQLEAQVTQFYNRNLQSQIRTGDLTRSQANALRDQLLNRIQLTEREASLERLEQVRLGLINEQNAALREQQAIQALVGQAAGALKNLLLGAVGAVVGGAIVGAVLFGPLQDAVTKVTEILKDVADPARHARESLKEVGDEINQLVSDQALSRIQAVQQLIDTLPSAYQNRLDPQAIAQDAVTEKLREANTSFSKYLDLQKNSVALSDEQKNITLQNLVAADRYYGTLHAVTGEQFQQDLVSGKALTKMELANRLLGDQKQKATEISGGYLDIDYYLGLYNAALGEIDTKQTKVAYTAEQIADAWASFNAESANRAIDSAINAQISGQDRLLEFQKTQAQASYDDQVALYKAQADAEINNLQTAAEARIKIIQAKIDALGGPSATTTQLADKIKSLQAAEASRQYQTQLNNIEDQKSLILLQQRLASTTQAINLDDYQGKARLVAIDALLARMRDQNAAQDRFNKLLDIQYQIGQGVRRQQGETIQEFISRRAQYYRGLLEQAAQLTRQGPEAELEAERARTETSLQLRELEAQKTQLIRDHARTLYMADLQERLRASQEADRKAAEAERARLQAQITAIRQNTQDQIDQVNRTRDAEINAAQQARDARIAAATAAHDKAVQQLQDQRDATKFWTNKTETERLAILIASAKNVEDLNRISGQLAGVAFSYNYLKAQLDALGLSSADEATILGPFQKLLAAYQAQFANLTTGAAKLPGFGGGPGLGGNATGGLIPYENGLLSLKNTNMNVSDNIRWGEQGVEGGVMTNQGLFVLNNQIMNALRQREAGMSPLAGSTFNLQGTGDFHRDRYALRKMVKEIIRELV